jgi:hypothetical protein
MKIIITEEEKRHIMGLYEQNGRGVKQKISNTKNLLLEEGEPVSIINRGTKLYGKCDKGNCETGFGNATFSDGSKYSGNWVGGNRTYGIFFDKTYETTSTGTWSKGLKNGSFTEVYSNGTKGFGKYVNNKEQGKWSYKYSEGTTSVITYNNGKQTYYSDSIGNKTSADVAGNEYEAYVDGSKTYVNKDGTKSEVDSDRNKTYVNKDGTVYTVDKSETNTQDQKCINKIKIPYNNAVTWWKNKMDDPVFYNKLKKLNNYTDQQTKEWINKYKSYLYNNISGPSCPKQGTTTYEESFKGLSDAIAYLTPYLGDSMVVFNSKYLNETNKYIEATLVHEIQHALYDLKPMTPDSNWKKVFPYKVWVGDEETPQPKVVSSTETSTISKYGLKQTDIDYWKEKLKEKLKDPSNDVGYICRTTELASRVVTMKNLLGYSTEQKITVSDFKKFIVSETVPYNDSDAYYIVLCWVYNGMEDIQTFIDNLDKYVVAQAEPKKDDNIKDQTT